MTSDSIRLETATQKDVPIILRFIRELAEYERLSHAVTTPTCTGEDIYLKDGFKPLLDCRAFFF